MRANSGTEAVGRPVVQIRGGGPNTAQRGRIDAEQRTAEPRTACRLQRADVVQARRGAVREFGAAMARRAVLAPEYLAARRTVTRQRVVGVAVGAARIFVERGDIRRKRVEIAAESRLGIAERRTARAGEEIRVTHESCTAGKVADLSLEILDFVEILAPVREPVARRGAPQRNR